MNEFKDIADTVLFVKKNNIDSEVDEKGSGGFWDLSMSLAHLKELSDELFCEHLYHMMRVVYDTVTNPRCPNCNEEINTIHHLVRGTMAYLMTSNCTVGEDETGFIPDANCEDYLCSQCGYTFTHNRNEALRLLR